MLRLFSIISFFFCSTMYGQGIEFFEGSWQDAINKVASTQKLVFVDAYAEWCGPCKRMAKNVFTDENVGNFFNENFVNMKIDMEKGQGLSFRKKYPVSAFPTFFFLNAKGEIIHKAIGGKDVEAFIQLGQLALRKDDRSDDYAAEYEKGNRDYDLVLSYIKSLNKVGKSSLKIANDFIRNNPKLTNDELAIFVFESTSEADSRIFDMVVDHKSTLLNLIDEKSLNNRIEDACLKTVMKAVEYDAPILLDEAKSKMKAFDKEMGNTFIYKADAVFNKEMGNKPAYIESLRKYCKKALEEDHIALHDMANTLLKEEPKNQDALTLAEELCEKAIKMEESEIYYFTYAKVLVTNGKKGKALEKAYKAQELTRLQGKPTTNIDGLIRYIRST